MYVQEHYIFCFTHIAHRSSVGFCLEIYRAQNTAYANIKSSSACTWFVSCSDDAKNYRALIAAYRAGDFNKFNLHYQAKLL